MKTILSMGFVLLVTVTEARASGCSFYNFIRTQVKREFVPTTDLNRYTLVSQSAEKVVLKHSVSGKVYTLPWEKTTVADEDHSTKSIDLYDILFEEGNGCGPIYRCVTGQITYKVTDRLKGIATTYSFPQIIETESYNSMAYVVLKPLLPVQGNLQLDVEPFSKYPSHEPDEIEKANPNQCGYGSW
jgi:hypothetical protein